MHSEVWNEVAKRRSTATGFDTFDYRIYN